MKKKRIAILGSTGSIGINTLRVAAAYPDLFEVAALTAFNSVKEIEDQIHRFRPRYAGIAAAHLTRLKKAHPRVKFFDASRDLADIASAQDIDVVVIAMTGAAALDPFLAAVRAGKIVAPANKEALVMAGDILMSEARQYGATVIPVDSEQSAIFQCLQGRDIKDVYQIHLTASGGALRDVPRSRHDKLSVKEILAHPRWKMGAKITVDSATLMNKGFEVIEACRLFGVDGDKVKVVVHPEAIVHSMVEFTDGSILAQMGATDMRLPIQYALTYPCRFSTGTPRLDFAKLGQLTFMRPDLQKFPSLKLAYAVLRHGDLAPAVLNAADEVAVEAFLQRKIRFTAIYRVVEKTVAAHLKNCRGRSTGLAPIKKADAWARQRAAEEIERLR